MVSSEGLLETSDTGGPRSLVSFGLLETSDTGGPRFIVSFEGLLETSDVGEGWGRTSVSSLIRTVGDLGHGRTSVYSLIRKTVRDLGRRGGVGKDLGL